jgi:hypothetical protein
MIYLYAITDRPELPAPGGPGLEGLGGHAHCPYALPHREIAAVVCSLATARGRDGPVERDRGANGPVGTARGANGPVERDRGATGPVERDRGATGPVGTARGANGLQATQANLWKHEAVVEALLADRAVLPVRFGTLLADEAAALSSLAQHYAGFVANLGRVRGRVELSVRVLWDDVEGGAGSADRRNHMAYAGAGMQGRSYLLARLEEERQTRVWRQRGQVLAAELHTSLAPLAAESTYQVLITPRMLLVAAYLVERECMSAFQRTLKALKSTHPTLDLLCTGPWPPYSFVTAGAGQANEKEREGACA